MLLEFKSKAEMCHVPQPHEATLFGFDPAKSELTQEPADQVGKAPFLSWLEIFSPVSCLSGFIFHCVA